MNALQGMDGYRKEVIQMNTWKNDIKDQYLYDTFSMKILVNIIIWTGRVNLSTEICAEMSFYIKKKRNNIIYTQQKGEIKLVSMTNDQRYDWVALVWQLTWPFQFKFVCQTIKESIIYI